MKKLEQILHLVEEYINDKEENNTWDPEKDWISYSGPHFDIW